MKEQMAAAPNITLSQEGSVSVAEEAKLARVSLTDLQTIGRELAIYRASDNTLINASAELLSVCGTLARLEAGEEINSTRTELARAIIDLKYKVVRLDYPPSVAENLCLLHSIVLDEFILMRPWAQDSGWENRTLVADLFGFRDGGDRFYSIADRALMQPKALREFLEIIYIYLKLGYRGKYNRSSEHERDRLIDRVETSLNLVPTELIARPAGREIKSFSPPARIISALRKALLAAFIVAAIIIGKITYHLQVERTLLTDFEAQRAASEEKNEVDFVFSSETGLLTTLPRE